MDGLAWRVISEDEATDLVADLEPTGIGAFVVAGDGTVVTANRAAGRLLGSAIRPPETLMAVGRRASLLDEDGSPWPLDAGLGPQALIDGGHLDGAVRAVRRADGALTWLSVATRPLAGAHGPVPVPADAGSAPSVLVILTPLAAGPPARPGASGHAGANGAEQAADARFRAGFDGAPIGMAVIDQRGRIVRANPALGRMRGSTSAELVGAAWDDGLHPEDAAVVSDYVSRMQAGELPSFSLVYRYRRPDGSEGTALGSSNIVIDRTGDGPQFFCQMVDVTEHRRAEADLLAREERFRRRNLAVPVGIYELDTAGRVTFVTPRWSEITGRPAADALSRPVLDGAHPDDRMEADRAFAEAAAREGEWQAAYRCVRPTGEVRPVVTQAVPHRGPDGAIDGWLGTLTDLSPSQQMLDALQRQEEAYSELAAKRERERLEAQLAEARRFETLGRLAGGVAHDFNNLLGVISNYATFLARSEELAPSLQPDVAQISLAAERGADLTRQLLLFSRREQLHPQHVDLAGLVDALAGLVTRPLKPVVALAVSAAPDIAIVADRGQIEQMLLNLLLNARDAIAAERDRDPRSARGHIELDTRAVTLPAGHPDLGALLPGRYARITVADDGPGMAADTVAHAFEPFFTTKNRSDASGLGLATVRGIAEQAGGRVWITSTVGSGATVTILLPLAGPGRPPEA